MKNGHRVPAAAVLHYGQEIFEGIKAYRHADGSIWTFRPDANGRRLQRSAQRLRRLGDARLVEPVATRPAWR